VDRHIRDQSEVMIWIHKSTSNKIDHYKLRNDSYRNKTENTKGHLTILGVYGATEGREELSEEFYETLQKILDKVNKNGYIMLIGDMNARVGNNKVTNIVGTNGEATLNRNGRKLIDLCTFNNLKIMNTFLSTKKFINLLGKQQGGTNQLYENFKGNSRH
jgi:hypothetical protein